MSAPDITVSALAASRVIAAKDVLDGTVGDFADCEGSNAGGAALRASEVDALGAEEAVVESCMGPWMQGGAAECVGLPWDSVFRSRNKV